MPDDKELEQCTDCISLTTTKFFKENKCDAVHKCDIKGNIPFSQKWTGKCEDYEQMRNIAKYKHIREIEVFENE